MSLYENPTYISDLETAVKSTLNAEALYNKKIMISGATGLIGSFITDVLLFLNKSRGANITVYAMGRSTARLKDRFGPAEADGICYVEHDINNPPSFDFDVDYVINAASNAYPAVFNSDPVGTILGNIIGTNYMLEYALKHKAKRFLFVSSGEVYGEGADKTAAFYEDFSGYVNPVLPRSCYPASKRAAETLCVSYTKQYGLDTVIARPCHTYGPTATKSDNRANAQFVNNAINGQDIVMKSRGLQMRSYCYVADCASAILSVLTSGKSCEAYNIANKDARVTIAEFAKEVAFCTGRQVIFEEPDDLAKAQQTNISYAVLDSEKLYGLGWCGAYSVKDGIKNTVDIMADKN